MTYKVEPIGTVELSDVLDRDIRGLVDGQDDRADQRGVARTTE